MRAASEGAILVTGANGFIGRHLTRRLYRAERPVMALVRGQPGFSATKRLQSILGVPVLGKNLEVIEGDLTQPAAGLGKSEIARLRARVTTIVHCAADTDFFPQSPAASRAVSTDGPLALLHTLDAGRLERWCQISTAFVCGRRCGAVFESEGAVGQTFHNPYEEIKLESEIALRESCRELGIDLRILRPSVVVGPESSTQGGSPSSLLFRFIRLAAALAARARGAELAVRIEGRPGARFNIVPVEYVSAAIAVLSEQPGAANGTFHLVVSQPPTQEAMLHMITGRLGVKGLRLIDQRREPILDPSPLENRVARMLAPYREYLEQDVSFDDRAAGSLLNPVGISCSRFDQRTIDYLIAISLSEPGRSIYRDRYRQPSECD